MAADLTLAYAALSDIGLRRSSNQDSKAVLEPWNGEQYRRRGWLFLVADGMGAHAAGEMASDLAARHVPLAYEKAAARSPALALRTNGSAIDQVLLADFEAAHAWALDVHGFAAIKSGATFTKATETGTDDLAADVLTATRTNETPVLLCSPLAWEIVNTKVNTDLNQTLAQAYATSAGGRFVAAVGMIDGDIPAEKALTSVANGKEFVGAGLVAGGYFPDLILARWGAGVDLLVDPYADADAGVIRVVSNSYVAAGIVRDSFRCLAVASADIADTAV